MDQTDTPSRDLAVEPATPPDNDAHDASSGGAPAPGTADKRPPDRVPEPESGTLPSASPDAGAESQQAAGTGAGPEMAPAHAATISPDDPVAINNNLAALAAGSMTLRR